MRCVRAYLGICVVSAIICCELLRVCVCVCAVCSVVKPIKYHGGATVTCHRITAAASGRELFSIPFGTELCGAFGVSVRLFVFHRSQLRCATVESDCAHTQPAETLSTSQTDDGRGDHIRSHAARHATSQDDFQSHAFTSVLSSVSTHTPKKHASASSRRRRPSAGGERQEIVARGQSRVCRREIHPANVFAA